MKASAEPNLILRFMVACSMFGWCTVILMMIFPPATVQDVFWRKPLIGSVLFLICAGGSLAAVSPRTCSAAHRTQKVETSKGSGDVETDSVSSKGHHPDCGRFSNHTIQFRGNYYCAACTGLLIGGVMAMAVIVLYFFLRLSAEALGFPAVIAGQFGPVLGLIQFKFKSWIRLCANVFFVFGSCLILIGIDKLVYNVLVDLYLICLILVWILTRVMISQWDHYRICLACGFSCGTERAERKVGLSASSSQRVKSPDEE